MKAKRIVWTAALMLIGLWTATQVAAHAMAHPAELSGRVYRGDRWALYMPWSLAVWSLHERRDDPVVRRSMSGFALYAAAVAGLLALRARHAAPEIRPFGEGGWGAARDMKRAGLLNDAGTVVGIHKGRLLTFDGPEHQLVSGASRAGKGVGHVVPTLLCCPGSALVYDVKSELWELTAGYRSKYQHCLFFNPTHPDTARFNPLMEVRKGPNEVRDAQNLVEILINPDGAKRTLDVWDQNASQFLTALVLHVLYVEPAEKKHLGRVRELLLDFDATCEAMMTTPHRINPTSGGGEPEVYPEIARVAKGLLGQAERFRSSVRGTAEGYLTLWADEVVCAATGRSDFAVGDLMCLDRPVTLYLQPPPSDAARVRPLIRLVLNQIARGLMEHRAADARGRAKKHHLLMLLDEFPTLGRLPFFSENLRQMAGYGLKAHLIVQSFNDIVEAYGPHNTIIDNCHVLCCFASADTATQHRISQMTGQVVEYRESYSRPWSILARLGGDGGRSVSQSEHVRPLLQPGEIRTLPYDEQLVFVTGFKPFRTKKLRYYAHRELKRRVVPPPDLGRGPGVPGEPGEPGLPGALDDWRDERPKGEPLPLPEGARAGGDDDGPPARTIQPRSASTELDIGEGDFL